VGPISALVQTGHSRKLRLIQPFDQPPYVGHTSRDPDWRFDQHKAGYKARAGVRRFGVRLVPDLVQHLNPMLQWESLDLEAALADAFRAAANPWVEGYDGP
jgi:hypothetical protein